MSEKDLFEEYNKAGYKGSIPSASVSIPSGQQTQSRPPRASPIEPPPVTIKQAETSGASFWFWSFIVALILLAVTLLYFLWPDIPRTSATPEVIKETFVIEDPKLQATIMGLQKEIKKLKGDNSWLRHLLRVSKENLATARARIQNLNNERTADEKYHRFLKYALDKFYSEPFKKNEKSRSICFTTDQRDRKCYQLERPSGWFEGGTIAPTPARLRQL